MLVVFPLGVYGKSEIALRVQVVSDGLVAVGLRIVRLLDAWLIDSFRFLKPKLVPRILLVPTVVINLILEKRKID